MKEFTKSSTATRLGIDNTPSEQVVENLTVITNKILQPARDYFVKEMRKARSMRVNSGFRCPELNSAVGSSSRSQHLTGEAADVEIPGIDNYELACWIRDNCEFDQLILEFYTGEPSSGWVHVSYSTTKKNRKQCLTINGNTARGLIK